MKKNKKVYESDPKYQDLEAISYLSKDKLAIVRYHIEKYGKIKYMQKCANNIWCIMYTSGQIVDTIKEDKSWKN